MNPAQTDCSAYLAARQSLAELRPPSLKFALCFVPFRHVWRKLEKLFDVSSGLRKINPSSYSSPTDTNWSPRSLLIWKKNKENVLSEKILEVRWHHLCWDCKDPVENMHWQALCMSVIPSLIQLTTITQCRNMAQWHMR